MITNHLQAPVIPTNRAYSAVATNNGSNAIVTFTNRNKLYFNVKNRGMPQYVNPPATIGNGTVLFDGQIFLAITSVDRFKLMKLI